MKILLSSETIKQRILELAEEINRDYRGEELVLVSVLKGSVVFLVDLMRCLDLEVEIGFLYLSSYQGETAPQTSVQHYILPFPKISDRHVLIVEDILDTGASLDYALQHCETLHPKSLKTCILLVKEGIIRENSYSADYTGFHIPPAFVVGYGLDYQERYRHLPYVAVLD